jgi:Ca-activated chloride channel homolog
MKLLFPTALASLIIGMLAALFVPVRLISAQTLPSANATVKATAQQPAPPAKNGKADQDDRLKLSTDLVSLKVTVTDSLGRIVTGLNKDHFEIYDDKVRQEIAHFTEADAPISIGIIFDVSGSMKDILQSSREALRRFIELSHEDDDFFLTAFSSHVNLIQDFTTSGDTVLGRLINVKPEGSTALFDAVYFGVAKVQQGRHSKRALLIISDGEENHSRYSYRNLRQQLKEADVQVYAIHIGNPFSPGVRILSEIAELSGGRSFSARGGRDLDFLDVCTRIALELRHQYSIGFYPSDARASIKQHQVKVKMNTPKGLGRLVVSYRDHYGSFEP